MVSRQSRMDCKDIIKHVKRYTNLEKSKPKGHADKVSEGEKSRVYDYIYLCVYIYVCEPTWRRFERNESQSERVKGR